MTGKFITLEGGEGVGKTTNIEFIADLLVQRQIPYLSTREPGGTDLAEQIRALLLSKHAEPVHEQTELLLMFAARAQHLQQVILPALTAGQWVICDRFTDASYAYQGYGRQMDLAAIAQLEQLVLGDLRPDRTLLLDAPVALGMTRAKARNQTDRFEQEQHVFFEHVRQGYLQQAQQFPDRIKVIDANQSLDRVQANIQLELQDLFK